MTLLGAICLISLAYFAVALEARSQKAKVRMQLIAHRYWDRKYGCD